MPKHKTGPALFELYNKGQGEKTEQERAASERSPIGRSPIGESASAFRATLASLARTVSRDGRSPEVEKPPERTSAGSSVAIDQGRLHVTLTSRVSGIVLALVLVCVIGVFSMGRWVGHKYGFADGRKQARSSIQGAVDDEIATARGSQPVENLFAGIGPSPVVSPDKVLPSRKQSSGRKESTSRTSARRKNGAASGSRGKPKNPVSLIAQPASKQARPSTGWTKGYTYVVVQSFRSDAIKDAEKAKAYLKKQGIDAEIIAKSNQPIRLIATQGFDHKKQRDLAGRFLKRIRTIGKSYSKAGGRYKLEGYLATLTKESW